MIRDSPSFLSRPYAIAAAVGSLTIRRTWFALHDLLLSLGLAAACPADAGGQCFCRADALDNEGDEWWCG